MGLIREPVLEWAAGQAMTVRVSPLTLPAGRAVGDFSSFTLTVREDPLWPRTGGDKSAADRADPVADGWALATIAAGALVNAVPTFSFTMPAGAGVRRYAVDVWAALAAGGEVQLVRPQWLTGGARVE